tara:strand:+ start:433 stop:654 length:222 start_codon:yes stop_codon:yes gene_type:complete
MFLLGPNKKYGVSIEKTTIPESNKYQIPTNPPCKPIQPNKEPLSMVRLKVRTNPRRNKPVKKGINANKPISDL